jgi:ATP-dependent DNA helicase RecQ
VPRPDGASASGATVGALDAALTCTGPIEGPVLLLTATWRSGWTATVAGALLKEAGASVVYPFAVHQLA